MNFSIILFFWQNSNSEIQLSNFPDLTQPANRVASATVYIVVLGTLCFCFHLVETICENIKRHENLSIVLN